MLSAVERSIGLVDMRQLLLKSRVSELQMIEKDAEEPWQCGLSNVRVVKTSTRRHYAATPGIWLRAFDPRRPKPNRRLALLEPTNDAVPDIRFHFTRKSSVL